ncbi:hypothetical protein COY95_04880 [Candidatus Woesearchaeota archaeon CG_4_10_14_0_8_um_filter_47_5]|nr:MAG: hypothetical protein COY95_04880 [Candidatus Woesearchaeota archaeon CG_4_10_14_0_8_um_filter_47_5]
MPLDDIFLKIGDYIEGIGNFRRDFYGMLGGIIKEIMTPLAVGYIEKHRVQFAREHPDLLFEAYSALLDDLVTQLSTSRSRRDLEEYEEIRGTLSAIISSSPIEEFQERFELIGQLTEAMQQEDVERVRQIIVSYKEKTHGPYCSFYTLASIIHTHYQDKPFSDSYYKLASLGLDGIVRHEKNTFGVLYIDYITVVSGHRYPPVYRFLLGPWYGLSRCIAFGQKSDGKKTHPNVGGMALTYLLANGFLKGVRDAALESSVLYLTQNPEACHALREVAQIHAEKGDGRAIAFLRDTTPERLQEQTDGFHGSGTLYRVAMGYQKAKAGRRPTYQE